MPEVLKEEDNLETESSTLDIECEYKYVETDDDGSFEGYASVFNNKDLGNDVIEKGAFAKSVYKKRPKQIKLLYQHKTDEPIGVIDEIEEDNKGLRVKGRLAIKTERGKYVYELMKMGALDSMSIGYRLNPKGYNYNDKDKKRTIKEVDLMEVSMVTFPMNPKAKITKVKNILDFNMLKELPTERDVETYLREVCMFSKSISKPLADFIDANCRNEVNQSKRDVVDGIKQVINIIKH